MIGASRDRCPATPAATRADGPVRTAVPGGPGPAPLAFNASSPLVPVAQANQVAEPSQQFEQSEQSEQFQHRKRGVPP